ncbi:molecular chaperone HtpG [Pajaroellobacter abortibovis]|uniref:Chaperone protein HtpG n=1 Tax=Pajaroellobacter abortibovis TaxID=1882918 RepID=A0A1L6MW30_9BACT|nr:molecular chaperone HtpG [Pajaroellobacter abortibovis]APR99750.1 molecular chaperone HtpG [Pajaroellobacter abortibovis]
MSTSLQEKKTFSFQAEIHQLLHLLVHSLYSHKEVFLRELISNAADALDKLRFQGLTDATLLGENSTLEIRLILNPAECTLTIEDTGIGMDEKELAENLGTLAHSGTRSFLKMIQEKGEGRANLIGQFGVGFYSAYLVANRVDVISHKAGQEKAFCWSSDAQNDFTIEGAERQERGTSIILHLKPDQQQWLEEGKIRDLIKRYSDFVNYPIKVGTFYPGDTREKIRDWEIVNQTKALWQQPRSHITEEQYTEFYKHLTRDAEDPLAHTHFTIEGAQSFTGLLYFPKHAPLFEVEPTRKGIRLFVNRVFVMDNCEELIPPWLRFIRGILDSDDLPLNVSRETLQDSTIVQSIQKQVTKKSLELLEELAQEQNENYLLFWKQFGAILKEGLTMSWEHKNRIARLLRYRSSKSDGWISLTQYVARMPLRQPAVYYVLGESEQALTSSPYIEALQSRGYEVLYMTDPIDEWATESLHEFEGKPLVSAMRAELMLDPKETSEFSPPPPSQELQGFLSLIQTSLKHKISQVKLSDRLTDSPCCLVVPQGKPHAFVEQLLRARHKEIPTSQRILEINPTHPLVTALQDFYQRDPNSNLLQEWISILYDQALLMEGGKVEDPNFFGKRITCLLQQIVMNHNTPSPTHNPPEEISKHG